jgi:hypothetical protein
LAAESPYRTADPRYLGNTRNDQNARSESRAQNDGHLVRVERSDRRVGAVAGRAISVRCAVEERAALPMIDDRSDAAN